jgi:hypothetical protein
MTSGIEPVTFRLDVCVCVYICIYTLFFRVVCFEILPVNNETPNHEDVGGSGVIAPPLLTSAVDGSEG